MNTYKLLELFEEKKAATKGKTNKSKKKSSKKQEDGGLSKGEKSSGTGLPAVVFNPTYDAKGNLIIDEQSMVIVGITQAAVPTTKHDSLVEQIDQVVEKVGCYSRLYVEGAFLPQRDVVSLFREAYEHIDVRHSSDTRQIIESLSKQFDTIWIVVDHGQQGDIFEQLQDISADLSAVLVTTSGTKDSSLLESIHNTNTYSKMFDQEQSQAISEMFEVCCTVEDLLEKKLSRTERTKRAMRMRRRKKEMARKRALALKKRAEGKRVTKRSRRKVIADVKQRLSGGRDIKTASPAEKQRIEDMISRRRALISRLAKRAERYIRGLDSERLRREEFGDDPKQREIGTLDLVKLYKKITPQQDNKEEDDEI